MRIHQLLILGSVLYSSILFADDIKRINPYAWDGSALVQPEQDPDYFVHSFKRLPAVFVGGCGKGDQRLKDQHAYLKIKEPILKREINAKLKSHEEFTAMTFIVAGKKMYINILDQGFVRRYCQTKPAAPLTVYLDGFQVDIQFDLKFQREMIIEKVHSRP